MVIFRRDETAVKPATIRRDMSLWRTHIKDIVIDEIQIKEYLVSDISAKLLYSFFRKITKDKKYTKKRSVTSKAPSPVCLPMR